MSLQVNRVQQDLRSISISLCSFIHLHCERAVPSGCHRSLSCRLTLIHHWLLTGFTLTHPALASFPSSQLFNRQLPSSLKLLHLHLHFVAHTLSLSLTHHLMNGCQPFIFNPSRSGGLGYRPRTGLQRRHLQLSTVTVAFVISYRCAPVYTHTRTNTDTHTTQTCRDSSFAQPLKYNKQKPFLQLLHLFSTSANLKLYLHF